MKRGWFYYWAAVFFACWHASGVITGLILGDHGDLLDDAQLTVLWSLIAGYQSRLRTLGAD